MEREKESKPREAHMHDGDLYLISEIFRASLFLSAPANVKKLFLKIDRKKCVIRIQLHSSSREMTKKTQNFVCVAVEMEKISAN
jgi:hypothetical protein